MWCTDQCACGVPVVLCLCRCGSVDADFFGRLTQCATRQSNADGATRGMTMVYSIRYDSYALSQSMLWPPCSCCDMCVPSCVSVSLLCRLRGKERVPAMCVPQSTRMSQPTRTKRDEHNWVGQKKRKTNRTEGREGIRHKEQHFNVCK